MGGKVIYAEDANGSIGKLPDDTGLVWIDAATYCHAMRMGEYTKGRK